MDTILMVKEEIMRQNQVTIFAKHYRFQPDIFSLSKVQVLASYLAIGGGEFFNPLACVTSS